MIVMWKLFRSKRKKTGHTLSDDDRERSAETRRQNAELKKIIFDTRKIELEALKLEKEADIQDLRNELFPQDDEDEENNIEDTLLMSILTPLISKLQQPQETPIQTDKTSVSMDNVAIKEVLAKLPKQYLKMGKKLPPEQLTGIIKQQIPLLDEESVIRAIKIIKE